MPPLKEEINAVLTGTWQVDMMKSPSEDPLLFCYGFWCPCCFAYQQRERLLDLTNEPYVCCAGSCPCGPCGSPCSSRNPWLCLEAFCCTGNAIVANRFMVQTRFDVQNDPCDNTLLAIVACLNCINVLVSCFADNDTANNFDALVDCINAIVCSCMLTQQSIEIKRIEQDLSGREYLGMNPKLLVLLPPHQQEMIQGYPIASGRQAPCAKLESYGGVADGVPMAVAQPTHPAAGSPTSRPITLTTPPGALPGQRAAVPAGVVGGQEFAAAY